MNDKKSTGFSYPALTRSLGKSLKELRSFQEETACFAIA